jgi:hypothetical protein
MLSCFCAVFSLYAAEDGAKAARAGAEDDADVSDSAQGQHQLHGNLEAGVEIRDALEPPLASYLKGQPFCTPSLRLIKFHVNAKTFYYVQLLSSPPVDDRSGESSAGWGQPSRRRVWLTLMLGFVPDASTRFVLPAGFNHGLDPDFCGEPVLLGELNERFAAFAKAFDLIESRLRSSIRRKVVSIEQWLDEPSGLAPRLSSTDLTALEEIQALRRELFGKF